MPSKASKTMRRIHSRFNHLDQLARNLERVARKPHNGKPLPLEASCTLHTIKAYCRNREKLWKAATK